MSIVFIGGVPAHWCKVQQLENLSATFNISEAMIKNVSIPLAEEDKDYKYKRCEMYDQDYRGWGVPNVEAVQSQNKTGLKTVQCKEGYTYDTSQYRSTIVTQVSQINQHRLI